MGSLVLLAYFLVILFRPLTSSDILVIPFEFCRSLFINLKVYIALETRIYCLGRVPQALFRIPFGKDPLVADP